MIRALAASAVVAAMLAACTAPKPAEKAPAEAPAPKVTAANPGYKAAKSRTLEAVTRRGYVACGWELGRNLGLRANVERDMLTRIDPLFDAPVPARAAGASVTFEPGARTAWHTHPLGQTLIVTSGVGRAQRWGGPVEEIRPGDVVWFSPGEKHWHGAAPTTAMTHIAIQERLDGKPVDWLEHVTAEQYEGRSDAS